MFKLYYIHNEGLVKLKWVEKKIEKNKGKFGTCPFKLGTLFLIDGFPYHVHTIHTIKLMFVSPDKKYQKKKI